MSYNLQIFWGARNLPNMIHTIFFAHKNSYFPRENLNNSALNSVVLCMTHFDSYPNSSHCTWAVLLCEAIVMIWQLQGTDTNLINSYKDFHGKSTRQNYSVGRLSHSEHGSISQKWVAKVTTARIPSRRKGWDVISDEKMKDWKEIALLNCVSHSESHIEND